MTIVSLSFLLLETTAQKTLQGSSSSLSCSPDLFRFVFNVGEGRQDQGRESRAPTAAAIGIPAQGPRPWPFRCFRRPSTPCIDNTRCEPKEEQSQARQAEQASDWETLETGRADAQGQVSYNFVEGVVVALRIVACKISFCCFASPF